MNVLIVGATGMIGKGVLKECLRSHQITEVVTVSRLPLAENSDRLRQIVRDNFDKIDRDKAFLSLTDLDACFYCLGISSSGIKEQEYNALTHDLTLKFAQPLSKQNAKMTFIYVSAVGADTSQQGRTMWARIKGKTENALKNIGFSRVYFFRPGLIQPLNGIQSKTKSYRIMYKLMAPVFPLLKMVAPSSFVTTEQIGVAMINLAKDGYQKQTLEVEDILACSRSDQA